MRRRRYHVLSGSLFAYWSKIEHHVRKDKDQHAKIQVIRLKMTDGQRVVGVLLPEESVNDILTDLRETSVSFKEQEFAKE